MEKNNTQNTQDQEIQFNPDTGLWESENWLPSVTCDTVVFGYDEDEDEGKGKLKILLIQRGRDPYKGFWALPGGFMQEKDENLEACVRRELNEETNVKLSRLEFFGEYSGKDRDPRGHVVSIAFLALVRQGDLHPLGGDDAADAQWFAIDDLPKLKLAFDHNQIIEDAKKELKDRIHLEPIEFDLLNKEFTMQQLQRIYIAILNPPESDTTIRDRSNFPKKMLKLGYIKDTGKKMTDNPHRSPKLYTFDEEAYNIAKEKGIMLQF